METNLAYANSNDYEAHKKTILTNQKIDSLVAGIDAADIAAIFSLMLRETLRQLFEQYLRYILGPIAAGANIIRAGLAWRQVQLEKGATSAIGHAIVETGAAIAITTAIVGSLAFTALFATITPIIFIATIGCKALFHGSCGIYYTYKSLTSEQPSLKADYKNKAIINTAATIVGCLVIAGIATSMLAGKIVLASLAIAGGIGGVALAIYRGFCLSRKENSYTPITDEESNFHDIDEKPQEEKYQEEKKISNNAKLTKSILRKPNTAPSSIKKTVTFSLPAPKYHDKFFGEQSRSHTLGNETACENLRNCFQP